MTCSSSTENNAPEEPDTGGTRSVADTRAVREAGQAREDDEAATQSAGEISGAQRLFRVKPDLAPGLYVVSTPIGNLRDITLRALDTLASVDFVCAEDTRVTGKLLNVYGVSAKLRPYHDHTGANARSVILEALKDGARVALASDAGTPLVSDPGYRLVREAREAGIAVYSIPGASSILAALGAAGLPTDRFMFAGFPPQKAGPRKRFMKEFRTAQATLVFFEGPSRVGASLADMLACFGDREAAVARELTKKFEEIRRGLLSELAAAYAEEPPRGEVVVLVSPPSEQVLDPEALEDLIAAADQRRPLKELATEIAEQLGLRRREVYERILKLRKDAGE